MDLWELYGYVLLAGGLTYYMLAGIGEAVSQLFKPKE